MQMEIASSARRMLQLWYFRSSSPHGLIGTFLRRLGHEPRSFWPRSQVLPEPASVSKCEWQACGMCGATSGMCGNPITTSASVGGGYH